MRAYVDRHWPGADPARRVVIPRGIDPQAFPRGFAPSPEWRARLQLIAQQCPRSELASKARFLLAQNSA